MALVSVVKKLERCERIGSAAAQGDAASVLHADTYQVIRYKVRIKDFHLISSNPPGPACKARLQPAIQSKAPSSPIHLQRLHEPDLQISLSPPFKLPQCTAQDIKNARPAAKSFLEKLQQSGVELNDKDERGAGTESASKKPADEVEKKRSGAGREFCESPVKNMECECCSMEEDCTEGYEERVRARLMGHWLCGLCEEAVGEEKRRVGGSVQAALVAHMQPCRGFSGRARSRISPPSADVAVPRAVCRLLSRHLSTPARPRPTSPTAFCRSSSCISSLPKG